MAIIDTSSLAKRFGRYQVLSSVDLAIDEGAVFGLVGLNGAGKTTLIRLLLGLLKPDGGHITVAGHVPWAHEPALYRSMSAVLEHDGFWGNLTFADNMRIFAAARGVDTQALDAYLAEHWADTDIVASRKKVRTFSRGQRTQCALCRAFLGWPRVCVLDEPTVGLDVDSFDRFRHLVSTARARGTAILVSSHELTAIEQVCDRVGVLREGVLRELAFPAGAESCPRWIIRWQGPAPAAAVLESVPVRVTAVDAHGCVCDVEQAPAQIPALVAALVGAGVAVLEVRPSDSELKQAIRVRAEHPSEKEGTP